MNYIAGEDIKKGDMILVDETDTYIYKVKEGSEPTQIFHSFFDEFTFGKFNGRTLNEVIECAPAYIQWCIDNDIIDINKKISDRFDRKLETYLKF